MTTDKLTLYNRNTLWSRIVTQSLTHGGIDRVVICPGGRSAALALTLADEPGMEVHILNDERSAGFYALGMARVRGRAVAICTTSGSAVANLLPALVEAESGSVPILVLTCDRPMHERGGGGPQYADHLALCRPVARRQLALGDPECSTAALHALRREVHQFLGEWLADSTDVGPAQINLPFHGTNAALDADPDPMEAPAGWTFELLPTIAQNPDPLSPLAEIVALNLPMAVKGLIIVGSNCPFDTRHVIALAERTQFPVLADAASGLRRPQAVPGLIAVAEFICNGTTTARSVPDIIIQIGEVPAYHGLHRFLERQPCQVLILDRHAVASDFLKRKFLPIACGSGGSLGAIGEAIGVGDADWAQSWLAESKQARRSIEGAVAEMAWGEVPAAMMVCNAPGFDLLHLGNSMSLRLGNLLCRPTDTPQLLFANRGVNGIDGTIACFLGEMATIDGRGLALIGDLTFLHDFAALELVHQRRVRGAICVVQNHGGAIFDFLPGQDLPRFTDTIRNARPAPIGPLAEAFGLLHHHCRDAAELAVALDAARTGETLNLIEIEVPKHSARDGLQMLFLSLMFA